MGMWQQTNHIKSPSSWSLHFSLLLIIALIWQHIHYSVNSKEIGYYVQYWLEKSSWCFKVHFYYLSTQDLCPEELNWLFLSHAWNRDTRNTTPICMCLCLSIYFFYCKSMMAKDYQLFYCYCYGLKRRQSRKR